MAKLMVKDQPVCSGPAGDASAIKCTDADGNASTVQAELDKQKVLFAGTKVSSGTIKLSDSIDNYDYFKVFHSKGVITEVFDFSLLESNIIIFPVGVAMGELVSYRYTVTINSKTALLVTNPYYITNSSAPSTTEGIVKIVGCKL